MPEPRNLMAGERESGTLCALCGSQIESGEPTSICRTCGAVHHGPCWDKNSGCGGYECLLTSRLHNTGAAPTITISRDELLATEPHSAAGVTVREADSIDPRFAASNRRWNRIAIVAFVVALLGFPTFGVISGVAGAIIGCAGLLFGVMAIVVACIALVGHRTGRRGVVLGVLAIVLGLFDIIGGSIGLSSSPNPAGRAAVAMDELTIDPESLKELPERIARAMRANVVIESVAGIGGRAIGSGVIMQIRDGVAHILTNRHTVDFSYTGAVRPEPPDLDTLSDIQVVTVGQVPVKAKVEWIAPHGVDLAIITAPVLAEEVQEAHWDQDATPHVGDTVFAVGNPHGLGWSHSAGDISQVRRQRHGDYNFRVLQTTAAINPGNSGGGLYDAEGRLIGINTMTGDKRFAEGLGFSIALPTLFDLLPKSMDLPLKNPAVTVEKTPANSNEKPDGKNDSGSADDTAPE